MIINILVCDDDAVFVQRMMGLLRAQPTQRDPAVKIYGVTDPSSLEDKELSKFSILFLDIDMGAYNGITIARRIRSLKLDPILIFVTNYVEYSPEGYEVRAFRYLLKSELDRKLPVYYQEALAELNHKADVLTFSVGGEQYFVKRKNIVYLESRKRSMYLHTLQPERAGECFYSTMENMETELNDAGFLRVHKSYLVNMAYIEKLNYDKVLLRNGETLPVSQRKFSDIKILYLRWKGNL